MPMYLTQKNHLRVGKKTYKTLRILAHLSKDLYNLTLYVIKQHYELNASFLPYAKAYHLVKNSEPYKLLPSQVAQQTMKIVERNYRSFFTNDSKAKASALLVYASSTSMKLIPYRVRL